MVDFTVQNRFRQTVFGNAVTKHTSHFRHRVKNGNAVPLAAQKISRSQSAGTAAHNSDGFAGIRLNRRDVRVDARHIHIGRKAFERGNRDRLVDKLAAAFGFARVRADAPNRRGNRDFLFNHARGFVVFAVRNQSDIALAVGICRAGFGAGRFTIAVVVGKQKFERHFARTCDALGVGVDDHAVRRFGRAGAQQFRRTLDFDHAKSAGAVKRHALVKAKMRDIQPVFGCRSKERCPLFHGKGMPIYGNMNQAH